jgi:gas vesicle protein
MDKLNKTEKVVAALLLGAVIGLIVGILFAPDNGEDTRKKMTSKAEDFNDTIKRKWNFLMDEAKKKGSNNKRNETPEA